MINVISIFQMLLNISFQMRMLNVQLGLQATTKILEALTLVSNIFANAMTVSKQIDEYLGIVKFAFL